MSDSGIDVHPVVRIFFDTMKAYILTTEYNHYDQMGEYFIAWFHKKPSPDELRQTMIDREEEDSCELCSHILDGGGRTKRMEDQWYHLREVSSANVGVYND